MDAMRKLPWLLTNRVYRSQVHRQGWKNHRPEGQLALGKSAHGPRGSNQDRMLIEQDHGMFAVFDGVGSLEFGSKAAELAVDSLTKMAISLPTPGRGQMRGRQHLDQATTRANAELFSNYNGNAATALAGIFCVPEGILVFHAGDSRVYRLRGGTLRRLTKDHRAADALTGQIGITRALGATQEFLLETHLSSAAPRDTFLICSDGIHDCISDRQLELLLNSTADIAEQQRILSHFLSDKIPKDDATFVLVKAEALLSPQA